MLDSLAVGGAERNTLELMRELKGRGVATSLTTLRGDGPSDLAVVAHTYAIRRTFLHVRRLYDPRGTVRLVRSLRREPADLIHVEDPYALVCACLAGRLLGIPVVATRHVLEEKSETRRDRLRSWIMRVTARMAADRYIAVSGAVAAKLADRDKIDPNRISVILNGTLVGDDRRDQREALRARLSWASDQPVLLMVAVLRPGKGHDMMLSAFARILVGCPNARLVIVGDGPLRKHLEQLAAPFGRAVSFLGWRNDIADLMSASDLVVLPSRSEALPTVLLEAAAAGIPALATGVGGVGDIIEDCVTGFVVPPGDVGALAERAVAALCDRALARRLGDQARRRAVNRFTIARQADETLALYLRCLDRRERTRRCVRPLARTVGRDGQP